MDKILYPNQIEYLNSMRRESDPLIEEMESFANANKIPILDWKAAEFLEIVVKIIKPKRVLEIGTAIAYSSIRIARNLKKKSIIDTIEKSLDNISLATENINKAGMTSSINLIHGDALVVMPSLEKKYDLIFLDADKQDYEKLFYYSIMLLKKGGVLFVDNLLWHGFAASSKVPPQYKNSTTIIRKFNELFINHSALKSSILPIGDGIGLGIKIESENIK